MPLELTPRSTPLSLSREDACDDTPVSHRYRPERTLRIILADDHPVVLKGVEMALRASGPTFSIVALATNADELIGHLTDTPCDLTVPRCECWSTSMARG